MKRTQIKVVTKRASKGNIKNMVSQTLGEAPCEISDFSLKRSCMNRRLYARVIFGFLM